MKWVSWFDGVLAWWRLVVAAWWRLPGCRAGQGGKKKKPPGNNKSDVSVNRKKGGMCV